jgi:hypothetical protein
VGRGTESRDGKGCEGKKGGTVECQGRARGSAAIRPPPGRWRNADRPSHPALLRPRPRSAFALAKRVLLAEGHAFDANNRPIPLGSDEKRDAVERAATAWELYKVIGCGGGRAESGQRGAQGIVSGAALGV